VSSKGCKIRFRSGDLISPVDEVTTCDDEVSAAMRAKTGNQSLGVATLVRLKGNTAEKRENNVKLARKTASSPDIARLQRGFAKNISGLLKLLTKNGFWARTKRTKP
jgi:hypothetical protein